MNRKEVEREHKIAETLFKYLSSRQIRVSELRDIVDNRPEEFTDNRYTVQFKNDNEGRSVNGIINAGRVYDGEDGPENIFYTFSTDDHIILDHSSFYESDYGSTWYVVKDSQ